MSNYFDIQLTLQVLSLRPKTVVTIVVCIISIVDSSRRYDYYHIYKCSEISTYGYYIYKHFIYLSCSSTFFTRLA